MARSSPISMTLPPFAGATRRLILINVVVFFALPILHYFAPAAVDFAEGHLLLEPLAVAHGQVWQLLTYAFLPLDLLGALFGMLALWFVGSYLEGMFGSRWLLEFYLACTVLGAAISSALTFTHLPGLRPDVPMLGAWPPILGLMVAFAVFAGEQEVRLFFVLTLKAKYMVVIYVLFSLAILLKGGDKFGALTELCCAAVGFVYARMAPRRGIAFGVSEQFFALRNEYYRMKRRRAARKFEVYMRKQNRVVHFDKDGRYVDPDEARRDPKDRSWMN
ncbi:rhomboid family intramembrane serine protease [Granulicella sp. WH15]|uniref:rhomboid family intramembrane serine protease n=1 Tax=Granulicella sp. WH15 TaxID=2602070 RepID=UPI0013673EE9|nr:rhomboid family intramembrane serine protease [Granulicella sp. WH15]QHN02446.1 rhomboid family intramembrane serine protease [Granulicella sp. WH15]